MQRVIFRSISGYIPASGRKEISFLFPSSWPLNLINPRSRFKCDVCQQAFTQVGTFKAHLARHTGLKPFCCEICGKAFPVKQRLIVHLRVHSGEKPVISSLIYLPELFYSRNFYFPSTLAIIVGKSLLAAGNSSSTSGRTQESGPTNATSATSGSPVPPTSRYIQQSITGCNILFICCFG